MNKLKQHVMGAIHTDQVRMHSRLYFFARSTLWLVSILLAFSVALFLLSFAIFMLRGNGLLATSAFGVRGLMPLLFSLPWLIGLAIVMLIVTIEVMSLRFALVYKRPLIYSVLAVLAVTTLGASAIAHTTMHERMFRLGREGKLPSFGARFYEGALRERPDVHVGTIVSVGDQLVIETRTGSTTTVFLTEETRRPAKLTP
ncbi:MAG: hypothetical protein KBE09_05095, partial [Candidatus Pacebacteria bacterium]|nr:hypothetical protein [Candidatus Paceibacterota bacterium]